MNERENDNLNFSGQLEDIRGRFRTLTYKFRTPVAQEAETEDQPMSWDKWKQVVIKNIRSGVPENLAPESFEVSDALLETFQEMFPVDKYGFVEKNKYPDAAKRIMGKFETARNFVLRDGKLLVQKQNGGSSSITNEYSMVSHFTSSNQVGAIHTHPSHKAYPSSGDVMNMLSFNFVRFQYIVSRSDVIGLFATNKTPFLPSSDKAKDFMLKMGIKNGRNVGKKSGAWSLRQEDLDNLNILCYRARRGDNIFTRVTSQS